MEGSCLPELGKPNGSNAEHQANFVFTVLILRFLVAGMIPSLKFTSHAEQQSLVSALHGMSVPPNGQRNGRTGSTYNPWLSLLPWMSPGQGTECDEGEGVARYLLVYIKRQHPVAL